MFGQNPQVVNPFPLRTSQLPVKYLLIGNCICSSCKHFCLPLLFPSPVKTNTDTF